MEIRLVVGRAVGWVYRTGGGREENEGNLAKPQYKTEASSKKSLLTVSYANIHYHEG